MKGGALLSVATVALLLLPLCLPPAATATSTAPDRPFPPRPPPALCATEAAAASARAAAQQPRAQLSETGVLYVPPPPLLLRGGCSSQYSAAMGIPKYRQWLQERFPQAFTKRPTLCADHVYVDCNSIMHEVGRQVSSEREFMERLCSRLDQLFGLIRPSLSVCLAVDGPACWAKAAEQRKRRASNHKKASASSGAGGDGGQRSSRRAPSFSRNVLTPGCPFMEVLTSGLENWCAERMRPGWCLAGCRTAVVSGARAVGEGEHKMLSQMLVNGSRAISAAAAAGPSDAEPSAPADPCSHVFVSGDADLFLLSLVQGEGCYFLVFVQLFEKYGALIERNTALIEKLSPCRARAACGCCQRDFICVQQQTDRAHRLVDRGAGRRHRQRVRLRCSPLLHLTLVWVYLLVN
eukprot:SAG31_NODE_3690_length_3986_cov_1.671984_6_plen_407_part_00